MSEYIFTITFCFPNLILILINRTNNTCETAHNEKEILGEDNVEDDPFDTAFAENILPGKAELKLIENEILNNDNDFDPRAAVNDDQFSAVINKVSIKVTDPTGERESISSLDRISGINNYQ